jgi:hypothetical protein
MLIGTGAMEVCIATGGALIDPGAVLPAAIAAAAGLGTDASGLASATGAPKKIKVAVVATKRRALIWGMVFLQNFPGKHFPRA